MMSEAQSETLLQHAAFLRRLARALLRDEHGAEDVEQETMIAAWSRPPGREVPLRAWLARIATRLALRARRAEGRRDQRERQGAREEAQPPPVDALAQAETLRRVTDAVLALDEPYRSTVLQRFYRGESIAEIAAREGVPEPTVRSRSRRALQELRRRLERETEGDWRAGLALLLPGRETVAGTAMVGTADSVSGGILVTAQTKTAWGIVITAAGLIGVGVLGRSVLFSPTEGEQPNPVTGRTVDGVEAPPAEATTAIDERQGGDEAAAGAARVAKDTPTRRERGRQ
jgi:RNA polymerase sigma-70 factor (ECF subfamily)